MRVLFDIVHPAHVHFYRHLIGELETAGHATAVVARDTDVTTDLLRWYGIPHEVVTGAGRSGLAGLAVELVRRDWALVRAARRFGADVILTRNPAGVQAARIRGIRGVFDTDDGSAVGIHFHVAAPFAHVITAPDCITERLGRRRVAYPSYKPLAFLHPCRFSPDPAVRSELGVGGHEPYVVLRLVAFKSSHDRRCRGLDPALTHRLIDRIEPRGRVFISSESPLPADLERWRVPVAPHRLHDALAYATACVTDGQSMAGEAAVLGVPSLRYSTTTGRLAVFEDIRRRYGLVEEFGPGEEAAFLRAAEVLVAEADRDRWQVCREKLLEDKCDLTAWMLDFLERGQTVAAPR
jgi:predicted glycosyltransferase